MQLTTVRIEKPEPVNFILGQTHFIKTVEDVHEALVNAVPGIKFGLAFCEASGKCLVRWSGTDAAMIELAQKNALALGAGHTFIVFLGEGFYPVNVLNARQGGAGGLPHLLRHGQPDGGDRGRDGAGPRRPGRDRRLRRRKGSRAKRTSPGARISCGRSATSSNQAGGPRGYTTGKGWKASSPPKARSVATRESSADFVVPSGTCNCPLENRIHLEHERQLAGRVADGHRGWTSRLPPGVEARQAEKET